MAVRAASRPWSLALEGARSEAMDQATFESGAAPGCHGVTWKDAQGRAWSGIPLWLLVGWVDDARRHGTGAFADDLAAGYDVDLVGAGGARVSFAGGAARAQRRHPPRPPARRRAAVRRTPSRCGSPGPAWRRARTSAAS